MSVTETPDGILQVTDEGGTRLFPGSNPAFTTEESLVAYTGTAEGGGTRFIAVPFTEIFGATENPDEFVFSPFSSSTVDGIDRINGLETDDVVEINLSDVSAAEFDYTVEDGVLSFFASEFPDVMYVEISLGDLTVEEALSVIVVNGEPFEAVTPPITGAEGNFLFGTDADDIFAFAEGDSTKSSIDTVFDWAPGDTIDLSALGLTSDDIEVREIGGGSILKLIEGFGADDFQLKIQVGDNDIANIINSIEWADDDETVFPPDNDDDPNIIEFSGIQETRVGTEGDDVFTFDAGDSTTGSIDTVFGWEAGDTFDFSALGIASTDIEVRLVGDGLLKIITGFDADDFQLKIDLGITPANILFVNDTNGNLASYEIDTGEYSYIGNAGIRLTDIAMSADGRLFGTSFNALYEIDVETADATFIGNYGRANGVNALTFLDDGTLVAASNSSLDIFAVDIDTAELTSLGTTGYRSSGDLTMHEGQLLMSTTNNQLIAIDLTDEALTVELIGDTASSTYGLASLGDDALYSASRTSVFEVNDDNGMTELLIDFASEGLGSIWGMTSSNEDTYSVDDVLESVTGLTDAGEVSATEMWADFF